ncbi:hypothetical protein SLH46_01625 [Draconibacterium sp. IB214405]|uniref:hypothetical protein n=1 Tax=Draconibacterium sp. IB214405 TaxID=3097352 RepID=UPI002A13D8A2|nr:hypothetical protein [Draconibacterium sp. IB214405]MDX8337862.1 hypothetical protein [Draconibacterium sp. IB214405]
MKKQISALIVMAFFTIGFWACNDNNLDNPGDTTLDVQIEALNKSYALPVDGSGLKSAAADSVYMEWDSVHLVISSIKFEAELKSQVTMRDSIEVSYKWSGPQFADLLNPDITFGNFLLQPGYYDEIEIEVKGGRGYADSIPVFYMAGMFHGSTATLPVEVMIDEEVVFKTEQDSVVVGEEGVDLTSYIQLSLSDLMEDIDPNDLDNATLTNGVIVISRESNRYIYYVIRKNLGKRHHSYCDFSHHKKKH